MIHKIFDLIIIAACRCVQKHPIRIVFDVLSNLRLQQQKNRRNEIVVDDRLDLFIVLFRLNIHLFWSARNDIRDRPTHSLQNVEIWRIQKVSEVFNGSAIHDILQIDGFR